MIRGWYHNRKNGQRLLSIDEIARACCISEPAVKKWMAGRIPKSGQTGTGLVDAAEVIWFLVRNSLPVSASLLPPNTRKILFIAKDDYEFQDKCEKFDIICRFFAGNHNILVETSTVERFADLSILTCSPYLIVIFFKVYSPETLNTCNLLSSFPEQKTILFVDDSIKSDIDRALGKLPAQHLVIRDSLPVEQLIPQLRSVFHN